MLIKSNVFLTFTSAVLIGGCAAQFRSQPAVVGFTAAFQAPITESATSKINKPVVSGTVTEVSTGEIRFYSDDACSNLVGEGVIENGAYSQQIGPFTESGKIQPYLKISTKDDKGVTQTTDCMQMTPFYVLDLTVSKDKTPPPNATNFSITPRLPAH